LFNEQGALQHDVPVVCDGAHRLFPGGKMAALLEISAIAARICKSPAE
jgi:hypothetical protein